MGETAGNADGGGSTFMGIGIRNLSASDAVDNEAYDLAAAVRQVAAGLLGTTVQLADLVRWMRPPYCVRVHEC